jgi:hypothetical protein
MQSGQSACTKRSMEELTSIQSHFSHYPLLAIFSD